MNVYAQCVWIITHVLQPVLIFCLHHEQGLYILLAYVRIWSLVSAIIFFFLHIRLQLDYVIEDKDRGSKHIRSPFGMMHMQCTDKYNLKQNKNAIFWYDSMQPRPTRLPSAAHLVRWTSFEPCFACQIKWIGQGKTTSLLKLIKTKSAFACLYSAPIGAIDSTFDKLPGIEHNKMRAEKMYWRSSRSFSMKKAISSSAIHVWHVPDGTNLII